jgi:molybdenum cofactor cytidylyltransferase
MIGAVVPAAGRSRRFGGPKLIEAVDGVPMIERTVRALFAGGVGRVVIVVSPDSAVTTAGPERVPVLGDARVSVVVNPDPDRGMLSSIQSGLAALEAGAGPLLVLPADMPFVRAATIAAVIDAARTRGVVVSPRFEGRRGHPVALTAAAARAVQEASGAADLSEALAPFKPYRFELDVDDPGIHRDVDRPGDLDPRADGLH